MDREALLEMLKVDLGISTQAYDERLLQYLKTAAAELRREGVTLTDSVDDGHLQIMYAAWMWRKRDTGEGLPRMIRWQINNRVFKQAGERGG